MRYPLLNAVSAVGLALLATAAITQETEKGSPAPGNVPAANAAPAAPWRSFTATTRPLRRVSFSVWFRARQGSGGARRAALSAELRLLPRPPGARRNGPQPDHLRRGAGRRPWRASGRLPEERPPEKGMPAFAAMSDDQLNDIAEFLHLQVEEVANRGTYHVLNIVVGNAAKGQVLCGRALHVVPHRRDIRAHRQASSARPTSCSEAGSGRRGPPTRRWPSPQP